MKKLFFIFIIFCIGTICFAQENIHRIDVEYTKCLDKNLTTAGINQCTFNAADMWLKEAKHSVKLINKELNKEQKQIFNDANKKWLEYYNAEEKSIIEIIFNIEGTIHTNYASMQIMNLAKQRAMYLNEFLFDLKN